MWKTHEKMTSVYIYIYIYICECVCVLYNVYEVHMYIYIYPFNRLFTPVVTQRIAVLIRILLSIGKDF